MVARFVARVIYLFIKLLKSPNLAGKQQSQQCFLYITSNISNNQTIKHLAEEKLSSEEFRFPREKTDRQRRVWNLEQLTGNVATKPPEGFKIAQNRVRISADLRRPGFLFIYIFQSERRQK